MERSPNLLDEALGFNHQLSASSLRGRAVFIEDCLETSGSFVLHHLIKHFLSLHSSAGVVFVAFAQPLSHYERILRKLGCNLLTQRNNNRFFFIDMLNLDCADGETSEGELAALYGKIQKAVEAIEATGNNGNSISVMIDDISLMEVAANGSSHHVLDFLHYCYTLTSEFGCSVIALNHEDICSTTENSRLTLQMEYMADILIKAEPLATGLASDVHGQLTVLEKGFSDGQTSSRGKVHKFQFKVKENGADYFYPGTSV